MLTKSGVFIWWSVEKGYGLIESDGIKYYAHVLHVEQGSKLPRTGDSCTFVVSDKPKRRPQDTLQPF